MDFSVVFKSQVLKKFIGLMKIMGYIIRRCDAVSKWLKSNTFGRNFQLSIKRYVCEVAHWLSDRLEKYANILQISY